LKGNTALKKMKVRGKSQGFLEDSLN
jgi:hypothetical protein